MEQFGILGLEYENQLQGATKEEFVQLVAALQRAFQQIRELFFAGLVIARASANTPSGYLPCDGSIVDRTIYADLFEEIGTTWGAGDGLTTFQLPDFRGRTLIGAGTGTGLSARTLAGLVGTETHTLVTGEMPAHTHIQDAHNHTQNSHNHPQSAHSHTGSTANAGAHGHLAAAYGFESTAQDPAQARRFTFQRRVADPVAVELALDGIHNHTTTINNETAINIAETATNQAQTATNQNTGGGGAHQNMQPSAVIHYFVKY